MIECENNLGYEYFSKAMQVRQHEHGHMHVVGDSRIEQRALSLCLM